MNTDKIKQFITAIRKNYLFQFLASTAVYGIILNSIAAGLFGKEFTLLSIIGWGFLAYLAKEELPVVISRCVHK